MTTRRQFLALTGSALVASSGRAWAQVGEPFRLGVLTPLTGAGSTYGPGVLKTLSAAVEAINKAGGAGGRKIELFSEDDQTQPQAGVLAAKKLIEVNKVKAILGGWSTGVCMSVLPLTTDADVIYGYTATSPDLSKPTVNKKWLGFRFQAPATRYGTAFAKICEREGFKRVALIANNNGSSIGILDSFERAWTQTGNKAVERLIYEPNQTSYRAELQRVLAAKPDVIVAGSYLTDATILLKDWYQSGATNKWILNSWALNTDLVKAVGQDATEDMIAVGPAMNVKSAGYKAYEKVFQSGGGGAGDSNVDAAMNWDGLMLLALALEATRGAEGPELAKAMREVANGPGVEVTSFEDGRDALRKGQKINYVGASSNVDFNDTNDLATDYLVTKVEKGQFVTKYVIDDKQI